MKLAPDAVIVAVTPQPVSDLALFGELARVAGADASLGPDLTASALSAALSARSMR